MFVDLQRTWLRRTLWAFRVGRPASGYPGLANWGEGTARAGTGGVGSGEVDGVQATTGDVTWFYTSFATQRWATPGGDFVGAASAATSVNTVGNYQWAGASLTADVQQWLNNPATNFGWILTGDETARGTAKQF